jgi:hypothetical protein
MPKAPLQDMHAGLGATQTRRDRFAADVNAAVV